MKTILSAVVATTLILSLGSCCCLNKLQKKSSCPGCVDGKVCAPCVGKKAAC